MQGKFCFKKHEYLQGGCRTHLCFKLLLLFLLDSVTYPPGEQLPRCLLFVRYFFPLNGQFKRCVTMIVLSRQIIDFTISDETNDHKPAVIFDYNQCEGAVGKLNKMIKEYSTW
ncbi:hypothetical protein T02_12074 [Trichinella nativa]|uniref:Uncharacterized protein n=1 Tax=Trichinella nativa TaxID=6335 RepID=A0A0V1LQV3_9BILA|nr:hypothetical protein T02_12074 [Trichinella nativa]